MTITVTDTLDGQSDSKTFTVNVSDPSVNASGGITFEVNAGTNTGTVTVATFTDPAGAEPNASDSNPSDSSGHYSATLDWGDGAKSTGVITRATPATPGPAIYRHRRSHLHDGKPCQWLQHHHDDRPRRRDQHGDQHCNCGSCRHGHRQWKYGRQP